MEENTIQRWQAKIERAIFDDEGANRIRHVERQARHIEQALFTEKGESRIALHGEILKKIEQYVDRGRFVTWLLWSGWIAFGGVLGAWLKH